MTDLRIGVRTLSLRQPLRRALATAGKMGADGVQIDLRTELPLSDCSDTALREVRKLLDDHRLRMSSVAFPTRRGFGDDEGLDRRLAATRQAMSVAAQLGARTLVIDAGIVGQESSDWGQLLESLTLLARHGDHVGVAVAAQSIGDAAELRSVIAALPEGALGVDFRPADLIKQDRPPIEALATLGPHVRHVTASDAVRDLADRRVVSVPVGRGTADFPEILAALESHDYRGWIAAECGESRDPASELEAAVAYLRAVSRE